MLKLLLFSVLLVFIAISILGFKLFFMKNGKFPQTEIGKNKEMRKRGIYCAKTMDMVDRKACAACGSKSSC
jgi:rRNA maturation endonuclease Nob1